MIITGTYNNFERSGDRDISFSDLMREPKGIRVCDIDPSPICPRCKKWLALFEAKRDNNAVNDSWAFSHSEYVRIAAASLGIKGYLLYCGDGLWQQIEAVKFEPKLERKQFTRAEFVAWIESMQINHKCEVS